MKKELEYYMKLPYTRMIREIDDEGGHYYHGTILELEGCQSTGDTIEELNDNLVEAMESYIAVKLEYGLSIPEPVDDSKYSGKFVIRLPKLLHQRLAVEASREGVSLNQWALYKLAQ
ncbi:MAG: toxin-antitoxin system HicB family antitoxin [Lachnospiraceae bacterium]|mgnify:CR=1 FL=1|nr:toxin-antitoxin system HicB family antitoxin [Lachnospiraceae bacterium]